MFNRITIIGNLGRDPETKFTQGGQSLCKFSVATSEKWTDASGQPQEHTEWHNVVVWGKQAEACAKFLAKGSRAMVEGTLRSREYDDKAGVKRRFYEINATKVVFLSFKDDGERETTPAGYERTQAAFPSGDDSDIPF